MIIMKKIFTALVILGSLSGISTHANAISASTVIIMQNFTNNLDKIEKEKREEQVKRDEKKRKDEENQRTQEENPMYEPESPEFIKRKRIQELIDSTI